MLRSLSGKTAFFLAVLVATPCFGWGRDGHKITGTIATHYLTPEAKVGVTALLGDQSLAEVSTWADEIRSNPAYRWASPLHYSNVKPGEAEFDLSRDCPERGCVVSAIIKYAKVLRSKDASHAEKAEALKFLVHFVGDIHQPLHVSHAKDKGGNDIKVEFFHDRTNLHRLWDSGLIRRPNRFPFDLRPEPVRPRSAVGWAAAFPFVPPSIVKRPVRPSAQRGQLRRRVAPEQAALYDTPCGIQ
ncbi:MAG: S1/P1 nuclease [Planctomycetes bacterium]|nr:S1/P1 nuclease [Planctomycetota bacterium]